MNIFYSMQRNIKLRNKLHHITLLKLIILGMETPGKTQDGKIGAAITYRFYYEKIWSIYNTANSPKLGECNYMAESLGKTPIKP